MLTVLCYIHVCSQTIGIVSSHKCWWCELVDHSAVANFSANIHQQESSLTTCTMRYVTSLYVHKQQRSWLHRNVDNVMLSTILLTLVQNPTDLFSRISNPTRNPTVKTNWMFSMISNTTANPISRSANKHLSNSYSLGQVCWWGGWVGGCWARWVQNAVGTGRGGCWAFISYGWRRNLGSSWVTQLTLHTYGHDSPIFQPGSDSKGDSKPNVAELLNLSYARTHIAFRLTTE